MRRTWSCLIHETLAALLPYRCRRPDERVQSSRRQEGPTRALLALWSGFIPVSLPGLADHLVGRALVMSFAVAFFDHLDDRTANRMAIPPRFRRSWMLYWQTFRPIGILLQSHRPIDRHGDDLVPQRLPVLRCLVRPPAPGRRNSRILSPSFQVLRHRPAAIAIEFNSTLQRRPGMSQVIDRTL